MTAEDQLIGRIRAAVRSGGKPLGSATLRLGMGDDAAVIACTRRAEWVLSCDSFLEGVHLLTDLHAADSIGYKALARATSDIAAMGATPRFFLLTLALPAERTGRWLDQFLSGLHRAARQFGMALIGGDTTRSRAIFVSVTVVGEVSRGQAVARSGARPGDRIYVSGTLGAAQLGLLLLKYRSARRQPHRNQIQGASRSAKLRFSALQAHLYPYIRIELGGFLARHRLASAMIDISDGLSTDLSRLCAASRVGASIWADHIPCVRFPTSRRGHEAPALGRPKLDPLKLALNGGEDYELLFTVSPRNQKRLRQAPGFAALREIGEIVRGRHIALLRNGREEPLVPGGWDPFRGK